MQNKYAMKTNGNIFISSFAAFALAGASAARAADASWSGAAASGDWADGDNWNTLAAPGAVGTIDSLDVASFNTPSSTFIVLPDAGRNVAGIDMSADAEFSIGAASGGGNALTFSDGGFIVLSGAGTSPFAVRAPLVLAGDLFLTNNASAAGKVFNFFGDISGSAASGATNTLAFGGDNASIYTGNGIVPSGVNNFEGIISDGANGGALAFVKNGKGYAHFKANNTYTGGFTLNEGIALAGAPEAFGAGGGTITINGGEFRSNFAGALNLANYHFFLGGDFLLSVPYTRSMNLGSGAVTLNKSVKITTLTEAHSAQALFAGPVGEAAPGMSITLAAGGTNPGAVAFSGSNTFSGGLMLNGITVRAQNAFALGTGPFVINGGTFQQGNGYPELAGNSAVIANGNFTCTAGDYNTSFGYIPMFFTNAPVTVRIDHGHTRIRGPITADKTLSFCGMTKQYTGKLHLHGANPGIAAGLRIGTADYSGGLENFRVHIYNEGSLGPGPVEFFDTGVNRGGIQIQNDIRNNAVLSNDIAMVWSHGFTLFGNANSLDMGAGPVTLGSAFNSTAITVAVDNASATLSVRGEINDDPSLAAPSALVKTGAGTLLLGGESSYAGGTVAAAGTIRVTEGGTLGAGAVTVKPGATIKLHHRHAIADAADVALEADGAQHGKLDLDFTGIEIVRSVTFGGSTCESPGATFGAASSGAQFVSDEHFIGAGKLIIQPEAAFMLIIK